MVRSIVAAFVLFALAASTVWAKPEPLVVVSPLETDRMGPVPTGTTATAAVDTVYLMGGPGDLSGTFDDGFGGPAWHGWTGDDASLDPENHWHTSTYYADQLPGKGPGNHAMYCGDETIAACDSTDVDGGYGNSWFTEIEWLHAVADTNQSTTVRLTGLLRHDTEPGYDYVYLMVNRGYDSEILATWESTGTDSLDYSIMLNPGDYTGPVGDEIRLSWRFKSDPAWSDFDCQWPTSGACQIDDIAVEVDSVLVTFDDFEPGSPVNWTPYDHPGVGDFSSLRSGLPSLDPCSPVKDSYQANFIDDGIVVPGTGGTQCVTWCYGPDGWILNNTGGLAGPEFHIINRVVSPAVAWPEGKDAGELSYDVFAHVFFMSGCAGIFPFWWVRSTDSADPADLENAPWVSRGQGIDNTLGTYMRRNEPIGDLLVPDRKWVQVALGIYEFGFSSGFDGPNGTPAPYYDNVQIRAWDPQGPETEIDRLNRFADGYPEQGFLDPADLASNWCRVDGPREDHNQVRTDSLRVHSSFTRHGASTPEPARLHWVMDCNPVFDGVRPTGPDGSGILRGSVTGVGRLIETTTRRPYTAWAFDLPDSGWFYPGDRLRWYVTASDEVDGDIRTSAFPADTTEILDFSPGVRYYEQAEISALPSVGVPQAGVFPRPSLLFVNYTLYAEDMTAWTDAFDELGLAQGIDFDIIRPASFSEMNMPAGFLGYEGMILSTGSRTGNNLGNTWTTPTDAEMIQDWLDTGDRRLLMAGDQLNTGTRGGAWDLFLQVGVQLVGPDITDENGGARDLEVFPVTGNGILPDNTTWEVVDSCPDSYDTEVIAPYGTGVVLAHLNPEGSDLDEQAAVIAKGYLEPGDRSVVMPFDLARIGSMTVGKSGQLSSKASFLNHLLTWLETGGVSAVGDDLPGVRGLAVSAHPNPFNPATTIAFSLPRAGAVTLEIFDIQGRKVRTLIDSERFEAGRHEQPWDGRDEGGRGTSSGVYFYRFAADSEERVGKLTLLK